MSENKRFTYEYDEYNGNLFDNKYDTFYHIEDSGENIELLCDRLNELHEENNELNEQLSVIKSNGLKVLEFYTHKLKNADKKEFDNAREELWIVKEVLSEMGLI